MKLVRKNKTSLSGETWVQIGLMAALIFAHGISFAGGAAIDQTNIKSTIESIRDMVKGLSVVIVTIAFLFAGYQIAFGGKHFRDVMPIVIGAIIIGAAAQLATSLATVT